MLLGLDFKKGGGPLMIVGLGSRKGDWRLKLKKYHFSDDPKIQRLCYMMTRDALAALLENKCHPIISEVEFKILTQKIDCVFLDNQSHTFFKNDIYLFLVPKVSDRQAP
jgi:hypothetical protein